MGVTTFICPVPTKASLAAALRSVVEHNVTCAKLGGTYTTEEFAALDPLRHKVVETFRQEHGDDFVVGCMEKWTRGEDIRQGGSFVRFRDQLWLEVANGGGGANTTTWLKENASEVGWIGSEGKPDGFYEAPMVREAQDLRALAAVYGSL